MRTFVSVAFLLCILIIACSQTSTSDSNVIYQKDSILENIFSLKDSVVIDIQPFDDVSEKLVNGVMIDLKKIYPYVELKKSVAIPKQAYYAPRNRYKADSLLIFLLKNTEKHHVVIGLTSKDISTTKGDVLDWGVMGLGFCPGNSCVVSTFRLNKSNISEQLFKTCIHELGHTQGIGHCPDKGCFMRDAEGENPTDEEKYFCHKCKAVLVSKGWIF